MIPIGHVRTASPQLASKMRHISARLVRLHDEFRFHVWDPAIAAAVSAARGAA